MNLPKKYNKPVNAIIEHFHTKTQKIVKLKRVKEDDCEWRFVDDNAELAYEWNVIKWKYQTKRIGKEPLNG